MVTGRRVRRPPGAGGGGGVSDARGRGAPGRSAVAGPEPLVAVGLAVPPGRCRCLCHLPHPPSTLRAPRMPCDFRACVGSAPREGRSTKRRPRRARPMIRAGRPLGLMNSGTAAGHPMNPAAMPPTLDARAARASPPATGSDTGRHPGAGGVRSRVMLVPARRAEQAARRRSRAAGHHWTAGPGLVVHQTAPRTAGCARSCGAVRREGQRRRGRWRAQVCPMNQVMRVAPLTRHVTPGIGAIAVPQPQPLCLGPGEQPLHPSLQVDHRPGHPQHRRDDRGVARQPP